MLFESTKWRTRSWRPSPFVSTGTAAAGGGRVEAEPAHVGVRPVERVPVPVDERVRLVDELAPRPRRGVEQVDAAREAGGDEAGVSADDDVAGAVGGDREVDVAAAD